MRTLTLFGMMAFAAGVANAEVIGTFVGANESNTSNATSPGSSWGTTEDNGSDNLWETDQGKYSGHASWEVFIDHDAVVAYGATENAPTIATNVGNLNVGGNYWVGLVYGSQTAQNQSIRAGLNQNAMAMFDNSGRVVRASSEFYEDGYMNLHQGVLGMAKADSSGNINAYVAANAAGNAEGRGLYDGLAYVYAGTGPGLVGTFVNANTSNTNNAAGGDASTWATTEDDAVDGLWEIDQTSGHESWDTFAEREAIVAYGGNESAPTLVTAITGLTPGSLYDVRLVFGSQSAQNHSILGGLALNSLTAFDNTSDLAVTGYHTYEDGTMGLYQPLLGTMAADSSGEIHVYVAANSAGNGGGRALYDGVTYQLSTIPEPSTFVMLFVGMLGMLAYTWKKRK